MIYRIEHPVFLYGVYYLDKLRLRQGKGKKAPLPFYDQELNYQKWWLGKYRTKAIFGFPTIEAINNWFTKKQLKEIKEKGFVINCYNKKPLCKSPHQVIFLRGKVKKTIDWNVVLKRKIKEKLL